MPPPAKNRGVWPVWAKNVSKISEKTKIKPTTKIKVNATTENKNDNAKHLLCFDQMLFFSAPLTTRAPPTTGSPPSRPAGCPPDPNQKPVSQTLILGGAEMIMGFASRYAWLGDLDKWAASRLQVGYKYSKWFTGLTLVT